MSLCTGYSDERFPNNFASYRPGKGWGSIFLAGVGLILRDLYSPRNDPDPEMIPNPEMIPKSTPKWSRNDPDPEMIPTFLIVDPQMIPKELGNGN